MSRLRKLVVVAGTFSAALGIGFVMQNGDALAARFADARPHSTAPQAPTMLAGTSSVTPPMAATVEAAALTLPNTAVALPGGAAGPALLPEPSLPDTDAPQLTEAGADALQIPAPGSSAPAPAAQNSAPEAASRSEPVEQDLALLLPPETGPEAVTAAFEPALDASPLPQIAPGVALPEPDCRTAMTATALPAGLVNLDLSASCAPLAQVTFHHSGMIFTGMTDDRGRMLVTVPALAVSAVFIADLGQGDGAVAMVEVPEVAELDRAVLQWRGATGLQLHALEYGAGYGDAGHVWSGAARDPLTAITGEGGFLMELGDPAATEPYLAQIYTFPSNHAPRDGDVELSVEAEVTTTTCGGELAAQSIQITPDAAPRSLDLVLSVPGCDAEGELLVLTEMLDPIELAAAPDL